MPDTMEMPFPYVSLQPGRTPGGEQTRLTGEGVVSREANTFLQEGPV